jgi:hypothetical protein
LREGRAWRGNESRRMIARDLLGFGLGDERE